MHRIVGKDIFYLSKSNAIKDGAKGAGKGIKLLMMNDGAAGEQAWFDWRFARFQDKVHRVNIDSVTLNCTPESGKESTPQVFVHAISSLKTGYSR